MIVGNESFLEFLKENRKWACGHDVENGHQTRPHPVNEDKKIKLSVLRYVGFCLVEWHDPKEALANIEAENVIYTWVDVRNLAQFFDDFLRVCAEKEVNEGERHEPVLMIAHNHNYELHAYMHNSDLYKTDYKYKLLNRSKNDTIAMSIMQDNKDILIFRDSMLLYDEAKSLAEITSKAPQNIQKLSTYDYDIEITKMGQIKPNKSEIKYNYVDCLGTLWAYFNKIEALDDIIPFTDISIIRAATNDYMPKLMPVTLTSLNKMIITYKALSNAINSENEEYIKSFISIKKNYNKRGRIAYRTLKYMNSEEKNASELVAVNKLIIKNSKKISEFINPPTPEMYQFIRKAAGGGIISCNILKYRELCENVLTFDQISAYPYASTCRLMPSGNFRPLEAWEGLAFIFRAQDYAKRMQETPEWLVWKKLRVPDLDSRDVNNSCVMRLQIDNITIKNAIPVLPRQKVKGADITSALGKVITAENVELYCTFEDLVIYMAFYDIEGIQFMEGVKYSMREMPAFFSERFRMSYVEKDTLKQIRKIARKHELTNMSSEYLDVYKDFISAHALNVEFSTAEELDDFLDDKYEKAKKRLNANYGILYMDIQRRKYNVEDGAPTYTKDEYISDKGIAYLLGMYVSQWGRFSLACAIQYAQNQGAKVIYCHTDCIKVITKDKHLMDPFNEFVEKIKYYRPQLAGAGIYELKNDEEYKYCIPLGNGKIIGLSKNDELMETYTGLKLTDAFKKYKGKKLTLEELMEICNQVIEGQVEGSQIKYTTMNYEVSGFNVLKGVTCFGAMLEMNSSAFEMEREIAERELETINMIKEALNGNE